MRAEVYVLDVFHPTNLRKDEVVRAFNEDLLKSFDLVREIVESRGITGIENVEFYDAMIRGGEFLIEYYVRFSRGKIIGGENPREVLKKYYAHLRESRTLSC